MMMMRVMIDDKLADQFSVNICRGKKFAPLFKIKTHLSLFANAKKPASRQLKRGKTGLGVRYAKYV